MTDIEGEFYLKGGKCSHADAPNPRRSVCIGKPYSDVWDEEIRLQITEEELANTKED